jgi:hypothetical protein
VNTKDIIQLCTGGKPHPMTPKRVACGQFRGVAWEVCKGEVEGPDGLEDAHAALFYYYDPFANSEMKWYRKLSVLYQGGQSLEQAMKAVERARVELARIRRSNLAWLGLHAEEQGSATARQIIHSVKGK